MLLRNALPSLKNQIRYCNIFIFTRYEWDKKKNFPKLSPSHSIRQRFLYPAAWVTFLLFELFLILNGYRHLTKLGEFKNPVEKVIAQAFLIGWMDVMGINLIGHYAEKDVLILLQLMFIYEKKRIKDPFKGSFEYWANKIGKLFLTQFTPASCGVSLLNIGLFAISSCMPPFLLSIFLEKDGSCSAMNTVIKKIFSLIFGFIVQGYAMMEGLAFTYLVMEYVFIIPLAGIYMYIRDLRKGHAHRSKKLKCYKEICVLVAQLNECCRFVALPGLFFMFTVLIIFFSYVMITMSDFMLENPVLILIPISYFNTVSLYLLIAGLAGYINAMSIEIIMSMKMGTIKLAKGSRLKSLARKENKAMAPLKVRFANNFVDVLTPLVMMSFCIDKIVSLLFIHYTGKSKLG